MVDPLRWLPSLMDMKIRPLKVFASHTQDMIVLTIYIT